MSSYVFADSVVIQRTKPSGALMWAVQLATSRLDTIGSFRVVDVTAGLTLAEATNVQPIGPDSDGTSLPDAAHPWDCEWLTDRHGRTISSPFVAATADSRSNEYGRLDAVAGIPGSGLVIGDWPFTSWAVGDAHRLMLSVRSDSGGVLTARFATESMPVGAA